MTAAEGPVADAAPVHTILHESPRVALRRLVADDKVEFVELVRLSAGFLHPWVHLPSTSDKFDKYLQRFDGQQAECTVVCARKSGAIVGTISLNDIVRGFYQRAGVGYNAFLPSTRQGYMSEGFRLLFRFAFNDLGLHRLEADIQPGNEASLKFAGRIGFRREGFSPNFAYIDGSWRDHERWAIDSEMITL